MLSRLGYEVTVVDPYDGSGNGPREFEQFRPPTPTWTSSATSSRPERGARAPDFAAVYSISVLEHVPLERSTAARDGSVRRAVRTARAGCSIHAVDHVLAGWGADEHRESLERIVAVLGALPRRRCASDDRGDGDRPETYLVSAEAHNRWRGDLPYDQYPMRRIGSVQLFKRLSDRPAGDA